MFLRCMESWQTGVFLDSFPSGHFQVSILALQVQPGQSHLWSQVSHTSPPSADGFQFHPHLSWTPAHIHSCLFLPQLSLPNPNTLHALYISRLRLLSAFLGHWPQHTFSSNVTFTWGHWDTSFALISQIRLTQKPLVLLLDSGCLSSPSLCAQHGTVLSPRDNHILLPTWLSCPHPQVQPPLPNECIKALLSGYLPPHCQS